MRKIAIIFLFLIWSVAVLANPVAENLLNELLFTNDGWIIELNNLGFHVSDDPLSVCYFFLQSGSDTIMVLDTLSSDSVFLIIDFKKIESAFTLDPSGDELRAGYKIDDRYYWFDELIYGNHGYIAAPRPGESICAQIVDSPIRPKYYLDSSPTIGRPNDTEGTSGIVRGVVTDPDGKPISEVTIESPSFEFYKPLISATTDKNGEFSASALATKWLLSISKDGYETRDVSLQIWPDSTIELNLVLQRDPEFYQSYFPLQVGNVWKYQYTCQEGPPSISISEVTVIDNRGYYKLGEQYVRYDSLGNLLLYKDGKDTILYHLALDPDDSIMICFNDDGIFRDTLLIRSSRSSDPQTVPAGVFSDRFILYYSWKNIVDSDYYRVFARDVGLIEEVYLSVCDARQILDFARVNGIQYPASGIQPDHSRPDHYALTLTNYPNPFNSSTTLKYHLIKTDNIQLSVYDLNGRLVENLFSGRQSSGDYHFIWSGGNLPSGVYFLSLQAGEQRVIQKCMLLK